MNNYRSEYTRTYIIVRPYELNHHGVKGMKWGVRKQKIVSGVKSRYRNQMTVAKSYSRKHSSTAIVARQAGKTILQQIGVGFAAVPVAMLAGPAAPVVYAGASAVGAMMLANNAAKAGAAIGYRHKLIKD